MNINPWLAEKVQEYRNRNSDPVLRSYYDIAVRKGSRLSWSQYLIRRALESAFDRDPFLQTVRRRMSLPPDTIRALYYCHADCVADLLQLSEEEFEECARVQGFRTEPVRAYLKEHGYKLRNGNGRTYKVQSLLLRPSLAKKSFRTWALPSPGAGAEFDITRPLAEEWWVDRYYSAYEYTAGEEMLRSDWRGLKPAMTGGLAPDYREFFTTVRTFYQTYGEVCREIAIPQSRVLRQDLPGKSRDLARFDNDILLSIKRDYVLTMIDLLEQAPPLRYATPAEFLPATDERRLDLTEKESGNDPLQLLLITYVELRIDFENLLTYLRELAGRPVRPVK